MRTICLDIGDKRIGVAVSDPLDLTAQIVETIYTKGWKNDVIRIAEICRMYETTHILCGLPLNMDGSEGFQAEHIRSLARYLEDELHYEVRFQDERMTTRLATGVLLEADLSRKRRKGVVDQLAATYILQSFLDAGGWKERPSGKDKSIKSSEVWYMSENNMSDVANLDMETDPENLITLVDDEGNDVVFEHIMTLEHKGNTYICLVPAEPMEDYDKDEDNENRDEEDSEDDEDEGELVIMRICQDEEGNDYYETLEDEDEIREVYEKYLEFAEEDE